MERLKIRLRFLGGDNECLFQRIVPCIGQQHIIIADRQTCNTEKPALVTDTAFHKFLVLAVEHTHGHIFHRSRSGLFAHCAADRAIHLCLQTGL